MKVIYILNFRSQDWQDPAFDRTWASTMGGDYSREEQFEQLVNSYSEHIHMSARPVENARDIRLLFFNPEISKTLILPCLFRKFFKGPSGLSCTNFAAPEDVRILTYPDIPDYRLENALLGKRHRVYRVPGFLSSRLNWAPQPPHPQASVFLFFYFGDLSETMGKGGRIVWNENR